MTVKCIRNSVNNPNKDITNADMKEYLVIGTLFWVFGMRF